MCRYMSIKAHVWKSQESSQELVLSCHLVGPRDGTRFVRSLHSASLPKPYCPAVWGPALCFLMAETAWQASLLFYCPQWKGSPQLWTATNLSLGLYYLILCLSDKRGNWCCLAITVFLTPPPWQYHSSLLFLPGVLPFMCWWSLSSARLHLTGEGQEVLTPSSSCLSHSLLSESQGVDVCEWASFLCQPRLSSEDKLAGFSCCGKVGQDSSFFALLQN